MFQNSGRISNQIRLKRSRRSPYVQPTNIIRGFSHPAWQVLQESWSINSIWGRISEPWVCIKLWRPQKIVQQNTGQKATSLLDCLVKFLVNHKIREMIIPLMIVRGKLTRWSKSPAICRDILMIKGSESQLFTYPFVALIIHMRKSRGNIWASTRSGYSSNSGAEGREKWWRHPQHRISAPKLGSLSKIHQDFIFIGSFSQTVRFGGKECLFERQNLDSLCDLYLLSIGGRIEFFLIVLQKTPLKNQAICWWLFPTILGPRERNHLLEFASLSRAHILFEFEQHVVIRENHEGMVVTPFPCVSFPAIITRVGTHL